MASLVLRVSERIYKVLLVAYPEEFRDAYGPYMAQVFRDACRETFGRTGIVGLVALWARTVLDLLSTAHAERSKANIASGGRVERLRHALTWRRREVPRTRLWALVVIWTAVLVMNVILFYFDQRRDNLLVELGIITMFLGMIGFAVGELSYAWRRTLAGLLWVTSLFVFFPSGIALMVVEFWSDGTTPGATMALLYLVGVLLIYGVLAWRYFFSVGGGDARQG